MAKTYWEKLQDPQWQKKRLEAMQAKDFRCELCWNEESTLNVHHKEYFKGREPWEYDNEQLSVLCESCHENLHDSLDLYKWIGSYANLDGPNSREELALVLCGYIGYPLEKILEMLGKEIHKTDEIQYKSGQVAKIQYEKLFKKMVTKNAK